MRVIGILLLLAALGAALGISYLIYRQQELKSVTIEASAQLQPNGQGALCGNVQFQLDARTLGRWRLPVNEGQTVSGVVAVAGSADEDVGLRVWTPHNRVVLNRPERQHEQQFELVARVGGEYLFEFDNRHSSFAHKDVTVSVCVS